MEGAPVTRDYAAERYNRRTRAIERQATALERIADALTVTALADAAEAGMASGVRQRVWTGEKASTMLDKVSRAVEGLR